MLVGGGCQWIVRELMEQIQAWKIDMQRVKYLFIGHSHFDHCGAVPFLQKRYPHLEVLASSRPTSTSICRKPSITPVRSVARPCSRWVSPMNSKAFPLISTPFG
ncbi:MBL fold metallo-hydrolase [Desulfosarcina cetonica]|uniref:MBL fold metallo-hydrolase n=1 Tax=Desulfosarcina cetonica TaxID=90730 RepID=UPI003BEF2B44